MTCSTRGARAAPLATFRRITFAIVLLALFGNASPASTQDPTTAEITFVDPAPHSLSPKSGGTFALDVALKNAGKEKGTPAFKLLGDGCGQVEPATGSPLEPGVIAIQKLSISGATLPAPCHLELRTQEVQSANRSLKQLKLAQHHLTCFFVGSLVGCLIASLIAMIVARIRMPVEYHKGLRVAAPAWDFTKSWTSTLTFAGGILSIALALSALPELTRHGSKAGYATVALLLSLATLVAPLLFTLFTSGSIKKDTTDKLVIMLDGPVRYFFLSCLVMLAAGLAQIVVLFLLLHEVFQSNDDWLWLFAVATVVLGGAMVCYAVGSMVLAIRLQLGLETKDTAAEGTAVPSSAQRIETPRDWSLF